MRFLPHRIFECYASRQYGGFGGNERDLLPGF